MDVQLTRIQRWLDRLKEACRRESWHSAVAEAECLEAEVRRAREALWHRAEAEVGGEVSPSPWSRFRVFARGLALSLVALGSVALPLSLEADRPADFSAPLAQGDLEWITPDEQQLLQALRRTLSEQGAGRGAPLPPAYAVSERPPRILTQGSALAPPGRKVPSGLTGQGAPRPGKVQGVETVPLEEVLALLQVGQRALRTEERPVRTDP